MKPDAGFQVLGWIPKRCCELPCSQRQGEQLSEVVQRDWGSEFEVGVEAQDQCPRRLPTLCSGIQSKEIWGQTQPALSGALLFLSRYLQSRERKEMFALRGESLHIRRFLRSA
jgi:hypothetical protein